jgi:hypothetical protein
MEVIIGRQANAIFCEWLEHIKRSIACKDYLDKKSFWYKAKARYVLHTTGPRSMNNFFKNHKRVLQNLEYLKCNHFKDCNQLTEAQRKQFHVISHESNSWFTSKQHIDVPVGDGKAILPPMPKRRRLFSTRLEHEYIASGSAPVSSTSAGTPEKVDLRPATRTASEEHDALVGLIEKGHTAKLEDKVALLAAKRGTYTAWSAEARVDAIKAEYERLAKLTAERHASVTNLLAEERARAKQLRDYLHSYNPDDWETVINGGLPQTIRDWMSPTWRDE